MCLIWKKNGFNQNAPSEGPILSPLPFPQQLNKQAQVIKRILNFKIEPSSSKLMPGVQGANPQQQNCILKFKIEARSSKANNHVQSWILKFKIQSPEFKFESSSWKFNSHVENSTLKFKSESSSSKLNPQAQKFKRGVQDRLLKFKFESSHSKLKPRVQEQILKYKNIKKSSSWKIEVGSWRVNRQLEKMNPQIEN